MVSGKSINNQQLSGESINKGLKKKTKVRVMAMTQARTSTIKQTTTNIL